MPSSGKIAGHFLIQQPPPPPSSLRRFLPSLLFLALLLVPAFFHPRRAVAQQANSDPARGLGGLSELELAKTSDPNLSALGKAALAIRPAEWKHAETANFIYHFFHGFIATPVSVEAEFYYRILAKELERDTSRWERKCHIYIFEKPEDWRAFQSRAQLDPWTGGIHAGGDLFIQRYPEFKFKGRTLGHEVAHLVIHRFFGAGVPLWLNEGYAEYASSRGYASFMRARGYRAKPQSDAIAPADFIPLKRLTDALAYPSDPREIVTFYVESDKLVRFLSATNKQQFLAFFDAMSKGSRFESALWKTFGARFPSLDALEREFKEYAAKDHGTSLQD